MHLYLQKLTHKEFVTYQITIFITSINISSNSKLTIAEEALIGSHFSLQMIRLFFFTLDALKVLSFTEQLRLLCLFKLPSFENVLLQASQVNELSSHGDDIFNKS